MLFQKKKEDNIGGVLCQAINVLKVKVTRSAIKDYLFSHPYYPTLKSVCVGSTGEWYARRESLEEAESDGVENCESGSASCEWTMMSMCAG